MSYPDEPTEQDHARYRAYWSLLSDALKRRIQGDYAADPCKMCETVERHAFVFKREYPDRPEDWRAAGAMAKILGLPREAPSHANTSERLRWWAGYDHGVQ